MLDSIAVESDARESWPFVTSVACCRERAQAILCRRSLLEGPRADLDVHLAGLEWLFRRFNDYRVSLYGFSVHQRSWKLTSSPSTAARPDRGWVAQLCAIVSSLLLSPLPSF